MPRYIILDVEYMPDADYGQSLGWVAPALADSGLTMTEDYTDGEERGESEYPSRKWAGVIDDDTYDRFASDWDLDPEDAEPSLGMLTEYGHLEDERYGFDGMQWNMSGVTPIAYVTLSVSSLAQLD